MTSIAIDGPAGAGKSTIARKVARALSYVYVDTGAMYRAIALYLYRSGVDPKDEKAVSSRCAQVDISIEYRDGEQVVLLDGENVNAFLRTPEVSEMASLISVNPDVRTKLVQLQQQLAGRENVVMDGRDIGTVVLPDAQVKIYLTASVDVRAKRRFLELQQKGEKADLSQIADQISDRDYRDMHREISPLRQADDAVLIDTSDMSVEEVTDTILKIVKDKAG